MRQHRKILGTFDHLRPGGGTALLEAVKQIGPLSDELQSQYLLTFEPGQVDGKYHPINVSTTDSRLKVRTRAGYISASSPQAAIA